MAEPTPQSRVTAQAVDATVKDAPANGADIDQAQLESPPGSPGTNGAEPARTKQKKASGQHRVAEMRHDPEAIRHAFESGEYPYKQRIRTAVYEQHKAELQVELLKVQEWVKQTGQRVVVLFEGRDAAGKGGTIKRFMEHLNPRGARVVALEKHRNAKRRSGTSSATSIICLPVARSCCSTAPGTTAPASSG